MFFKDDFNSSILYAQLLPMAQEYMTSTFADELLQDKQDADTQERIKVQIQQYLIRNGINCSDVPNRTELVKSLYYDMAQFGFLTEYLNRTDLEEIDINAYNDVNLLYRDGTCEKITDGFATAKQEIDTIRRLLQVKSKTTLDESRPIADADLNSNIRITCVGGKAVDDNVGIACTIRFVGVVAQTRESLIANNTACATMLDDLDALFNYGTPICIGGSGGAGKTNTAAWLLGTIPNDRRLICCEEGSREVNLTKYGENGKKINSVLHLRTIKGVLSLADMLPLSLRMGAKYIFVSEMRSREAYIAQETARTGCPVLATTHCNSAALAYNRMVTLCKQEMNFGEEMLMKLVLEAFPIIVFQKHMKDGRRRITQIIEGEDYINGVLKYRVLWRFKTESVVVNEDGTNVIEGSFEKVNGISERMIDRLYDNGMPSNILNKLQAVGGEI